MATNWDDRFLNRNTYENSGTLSLDVSTNACETKIVANSVSLARNNSHSLHCAELDLELFALFQENGYSFLRLRHRLQNIEERHKTEFQEL